MSSEESKKVLSISFAFTQEDIVFLLDAVTEKCVNLDTQIQSMEDCFEKFMLIQQLISLVSFAEGIYDLMG